MAIFDEKIEIREHLFGVVLARPFFPHFSPVDSKTVQRSALCRSRRELSNEYLLAKIGVDTAENEPLEVWGKIQFTIHFTPYQSQAAETVGHADSDIVVEDAISSGNFGRLALGCIEAECNPRLAAPVGSCHMLVAAEIS